MASRNQLYSFFYCATIVIFTNKTLAPPSVLFKEFIEPYQNKVRKLLQLMIINLSQICWACLLLSCCFTLMSLLLQAQMLLVKWSNWTYCAKYVSAYWHINIFLLKFAHVCGIYPCTLFCIPLIVSSQQGEVHLSVSCCHTPGHYACCIPLVVQNMPHPIIKVKVADNDSHSSKMIIMSCQNL